MDTLFEAEKMNDILRAVIDWLLAGGIRILLIVVAVFMILRVLRRVLDKIIGGVVARTYKARDHIAIGKREQTLVNVAYSTVKVVVWIAAALMIVSEFNVNIGPLLAGAGIAGLAFGFGGQYLIRDLISGLFIILEDQYRKGDVVKIGGVAGLVEDINLRRTILRDLDGIEHHVPNGTISVTSNFTKLWARAHLNIGVDYDTNLEHAITVLNKVGEDMAKDKQWKDDFISAPKVIGVDDFADSAIIIKVLGDTKPMRQWDVMRELRKRIKIAFDKEGISIPFPHRTIVNKR